MNGMVCVVNGKQMGLNCLNMFWDTNKLPIDPLKISLELGFEILFSHDLPDYVLGVVKVDTENTSIYVNETLSHDWVHYAIAYNLGLALNPVNNIVGFKVLVTKTNNIVNINFHGFVRMDGFAENFANTLLVPDEEVRVLKNKGYSFTDMVKYFCIPPVMLTKILSQIES